jgi:pyruvate,orthophosphate dikinase
LIKYIYDFTEGSGRDTALLGGKGANLSEMTRLKIPVPPGFIITTEACRFYMEHGELPPNLLGDIDTAIRSLETKTQKRFGDNNNPLLISVRSGAEVSMPGMMDTILNLGIGAQAEAALATSTNNAIFAADTHRRFLQMFGEVVLGVESICFEEIISKEKKRIKVTDDNDLSLESLQNLIQRFREKIESKTKQSFPQDAKQQLILAIVAVFESWNSARAKTYRYLNDIPDSLGTAVTVQAMVFGNLGETSATGVVFTRNPANGENELYGDFLVNAQGEDVVAGVRTPLEIARLKETMPNSYAELEEVRHLLERHYLDMQDIEFTIEQGKLYLLQTRTGKRTAAAAVRIAVEMAEENLISKQEAVLRIDPASVVKLLHPSLDPDYKKTVLTKGIAASPGAASGRVVFTADEAVDASCDGEHVILVRHETSPEDIHGMHVAAGILTACGGKASHAAVVARGMGKPCVSGAAEIVVNAKAKKFMINDVTLKEGDIITIDGTSGEVIAGEVPTIPGLMSEELIKLLDWANGFKTIEVRANADTPTDAIIAHDFGAEGIGLCRTEHMFFSDERIHHVREMILAGTVNERENALAKLLPFQRADFTEIFKTLSGLPVTVRLLDPPLHEFLPEKNSDIASLAKELGTTFEKVKDRVKYLSEVNPMLGHRGCRLLITHPQILKMQTRAILEAAVDAKNQGAVVHPEIMVPLVGTSAELKYCREVITEVAEQVFTEKNDRIEFLIGTMIELPRACAQAFDIAKFADFFSFGTNDLTQMTYGFSRDDVGQYLPLYLKRGIIKADPFETLDTGVSELIKIGIERGRKQKPDIKISVCGEHGGDPASINFFQKENFRTVSCSPFRVPVARLATAQAALRQLAT